MSSKPLYYNCPKELVQSSDTKQLLNTLLTVDGKGETVKTYCLLELLDRPKDEIINYIKGLTNA